MTRNILKQLLEAEGVQKFEDSYDELFKSVQKQLDATSK